MHEARIRVSPLVTYDEDEQHTVLERLTSAIADLGSESTVRVAATLQENGITGERNNEVACPLAKYFRERLNRRVRVYWHNPDAPLYFPRTVIRPLPEVLQSFITYFDHGFYPYLDEENHA